MDQLARAKPFSFINFISLATRFGHIGPSRTERQNGEAQRGPHSRWMFEPRSLGTRAFLLRPSTSDGGSPVGPELALHRAPDNFFPGNVAAGSVSLGHQPPLTGLVEEDFTRLSPALAPSYRSRCVCPSHDCSEQMPHPLPASTALPAGERDQLPQSPSLSQVHSCPGTKPRQPEVSNLAFCRPGGTGSPSQTSRGWGWGTKLPETQGPRLPPPLAS